MDAATQVPLNKMNGKQLKAARAHVEMLWGKIKHETTWARFVRIEDYNDAPIFENEDHLRYLASLSRPRRINIVQVPDGLQTALGYLKRGWNPVPVSRETKTPIGVAWQKRRLDRKTVHEHFNGADMNTGVQLGPYSNGLTDVDLDCREALIVGALLLPKSNNVFGRKSKPRSHWLYTTTLADTNECAGLQFRDADGEKGRNGTMMLELRIGGGGKGSQSVFPGSVHTSGERVRWDVDGALVTVDDARLLQRVRWVAVATLLARHWPAKSGRHEAALTVGGFLARAGLDQNEAALMLKAIAKAAGDEEADDRAQAGRDAVKQYASGGATRGLPMMVEEFGEKVVNKAAQWLNYTVQKEASEEDAEDAPKEIVAEAYSFPDEASLERYDWLYGRHLLRGEVAGTVAPGGTGKSSISIVEALAMASGRQLLHDSVPSTLRLLGFRQLN